MIMRILYIGWVNSSNIGDEVLFTLFKEMTIQKFQNSRLTPIIDSISKNYYIEIDKYDLIVLGGGSLFNMSKAYDFYLDIMCLAIIKKKRIAIWGTGIDIRNLKKIRAVLDRYNPYETKEYLEENFRNNNKVRYIMSHASYIGLRGGITKYLIGKNKTNIDIIGDPAIIASKIIGDKKEFLDIPNSNEKHILINWGYIESKATDYEDLFHQMTKLIRFLLVKNYKIVIYPVIPNDIMACRNLCNMINNKKCVFLDRVYEAKLILRLIRNSFYTINLKLHASILSLSEKTPFVCIAYGLKCYDFFKFSKIEKLEKLIIPIWEFKLINVINVINDIENDRITIIKIMQEIIEETYQIHSDFMNMLYSIEYSGPV